MEATTILNAVEPSAGVRHLIKTSAACLATLLVGVVGVSALIPLMS